MDIYKTLYLNELENKILPLYSLLKKNKQGDDHHETKNDRQKSSELSFKETECKIPWPR